MNRWTEVELTRILLQKEKKKREKNNLRENNEGTSFEIIDKYKGCAR